jgi:Zn-dependent alcohol dehydrogenase
MASLDVVTAVRDLIEDQGGIITIDTTGNMQVIRSGVGFTAFRGRMIFIGVPQQMLNSTFN